VVRGAMLEAVRARGLALHAADGHFESRPRASADPRDLGPQDAVIVTVKAPAQTQVAEVIGPLLGPETRVAFVQNGIPWWYFDRHGGPLDGTRLSELDPGEAIRRAIGVERTLGGVVYAASSVIAPGVIELEAPTSKLVLGAPDVRSTPACARSPAPSRRAAWPARPPTTSAPTSSPSWSVTSPTARSAC
jgi:2-dehydropantoate 2-reductase